MLLDSLFRYVDSPRPAARTRCPRHGTAHRRLVPSPLFLEPLEERALPSFISALTFPAGLYPVDVVAADFNNDGGQDLAAANETRNTVSVLLGNGDGSFRAPVSYAAGSGPSAVAGGDFNGDGRTDLAVTSDGTVSVLLGHGDGTFQAPLNFAIGNSPRSVAVGEFNGDGRLDLAVGNRGSNNVHVLLGNGDGSFRNAVNYAVPTQPWGVAVGDFDRDGDSDLAVAGYSCPYECTDGWVTVLLGNGDGTFQTGPRYDGGVPNAVAVGEFNGDGRLDLAVANADEVGGIGSKVSVRLGNGDGTFQGAVHYSVGGYPFDVAVADVTGDGRLDLVSANNYGGTVSVLPGAGDGTFRAAVSYAAGSAPNAVAVADFDGDGAPDLGVANFYSASVSVLRGAGAGAFRAAVSYEARGRPSSVAVADFDGDGANDLAVADGNGRSVSVLLGNGDGTFRAAVIYEAGGFPSSVAVGDFDRNGAPDLAVANDWPVNRVSVLLGNGDGTFRAPVSYPVGDFPRSVAVGDFDGNGALDLAVANLGSASVSVLLGSGGGTFQAPVSYAVGGPPNSVAVGDFNRDGRVDLAVAGWSFGWDGDVRVLLGNGDGTFQAPVSYAAGYRPESVTLVDFDGDGLLDLAVANNYSASVSVLLGNGDGTFRASVGYAAGTYPKAVTVVDFNGDGDPDLAVTHDNTDSEAVSVLRGNGDGTFRAPVNYAAGSLPLSVAVGDLNGDAYPDLAVGNEVVILGTVTVLLNAADDAAFFYLDAPASVPAGQPFDMAVFALSGTGLLAHGYRGTVAFWSSDPLATLPEPYTFRPADGGSTSFPGGVMLRTPGLQELYAFDLETFTVIGYAVVDVLGAAPGGRGGAPFGTADFALAQAGLDLVTWTRPRKNAPSPQELSPPCGAEKRSAGFSERP